MLPALGLSGRWDSVARLYQIETPYGKVSVLPGSSTLRLGPQVMTLPQAPRFIDGRLRVDMSFAGEYLPALLGLSVTCRNLDPPSSIPSTGAASLDQFFATLLQKKEAQRGASLSRLVIDPGHGGEDPGSIGLNGVTEKTVTLAVAQALEKQIKMQIGTQVHLTRDRDYALTQEQRLEAADRAEVDALLQLHAQAAPNAESSGLMLFVRTREESQAGSKPADQGVSIRLAQALQAALTNAGFKVREIRPAPLLPLGRGDLPTVLLEMGYLSNADDLALLTQPEGQTRLAQALFDGLKTFADQRKETP